MARLNLAFMSIVLGLAILPTSSWAVSNAVVGTCRPGTQFSTIQSAINGATSGSTIQICPGTYPEILTIPENLTLKGVAFNKSNAVTITVPSTGVPVNQNSSQFGPLGAQVSVTSGATTTISDITIDGSGSTAACPFKATWVGVLYQGGGGSMNNSSVVNAPPCPVPAQTIAVFIDSASNFTVTNNLLRNCGTFCLEIDFASNINVTGNLFDFAQTAAGVAGIELQQTNGPSTITGNYFGGNVAYGVSLMTGQSVTVTGNTMAVTSEGVYLFQSTKAVVENNHVWGAATGLLLNNDGVGKDNKFINNTVFGALCGIHTITAMNGDTVSPNTFSSTLNASCN